MHPCQFLSLSGCEGARLWLNCNWMVMWELWYIQTSHWKTLHFMNVIYKHTFSDFIHKLIEYWFVQECFDFLSCDHWTLFRVWSHLCAGSFLKDRWKRIAWLSYDWSQGREYIHVREDRERREAWLRTLVSKNEIVHQFIDQKIIYPSKYIVKSSEKSPYNRGCWGQKFQRGRPSQ